MQSKMWFFMFWSILSLIAVAIAVMKVLSKLTMGRCKSNTCLVNKTVIITGANSGLGYETALALASRGANIIIADVANTDEAVNKIKQETGNSKVRGKFLDLSSLESVRRFCDEIHKEASRLDILINNAGISGLPLSYTIDGLQAHMQTNYFGHFLLTHLLIDLLKESQGRIIFVSSIAVFGSKLTLDNLNKPILFRNKFRTHWTIYCNSKLCELIASNVFAEKLKVFGITSNAVHPGCVMTPLMSSVVNSNYVKWPKMFGYVLLKICGKTAYEGAQVQINCALSKDLEHVSGKFFVDCIPFYQPSVTRNREFCMKIWEKSEELVRLRPEEKI